MSLPQWLGKRSRREDSPSSSSDESLEQTSDGAESTSTSSSSSTKRYVKSWERTFRGSTMNLSHSHIEAIQKEAASTSCPSLPAMVRQRMELKKEAIISAMRNIYWIATEEVALLKYESLNELVQIRGCAALKELFVTKNAQYSSHQIAEEMLEAISSCIEESTDLSLQASPFIGVMVDECTDIATVSNPIVYAKTFKDGDVHTNFLKCMQMEEDKAITLEKVLGLSTDGARAMTGLREGLTGYMKRANPYIVPIHCIAYRLSLATSQASKQITCLQRYKRVLVSIYSYFSHSSVRLDRLREIQNVLDSPVLKYKQLYYVRWLSLHIAVSAVQRTLPALISFFDNEASQYEDPAARGLTKQLSTYQFITTTNLLCDVLDIITRLSKIFQGTNIAFSIIQLMVNSAIRALQTLQSSPGPHLASFLEEIGSEEGQVIYKQQTIEVNSTQKASFETVKSSFIDEIIKNLKTRFPQVELMTAIKILDPRNLPKKDDKIDSYGDSELDVLLQYYTNNNTNSEAESVVQHSTVPFDVTT
ncbi:PREDICTED: SCAN domain-containing protein 3-like [Amphimedon queenslandica]|uniref:DUF4371 domain-containing protein n=2 Tax=Amphimedon queenslandica TaxID=400682 RepID=A0AAN0IMM5_AMPQE|nr:PREDICTED: SCAN domain-containing protein 3-like [Amphimedon queenslandica]|eukprot:XP_011403997.1 PREDICTED: SCAN domain-containing protein 3-like [Amphimedon queenslandica]